MGGGWLMGQTDYIFFIYGLALVLLTAVCSILRQEEPHNVPWMKLGLFGLLHGAHEWLEMLALPMVEGKVFSAALVGLLAVSFVFLLEFGREGWCATGGRCPPRWMIHGPLLAAACTGCLSGVSGANATVRYFLGLTGATWAALTLLRASRGKGRAAVGAVLAAFALAGYGIAAGVVVLAAPFTPASFLNAGSFLAVTGIPIQIVRTFLAILISAALWTYYQRRQRSVLSLEPGAVSHHGAQMLISLVVVLAGGWIVTQVAGSHAGRDIRQEMRLATIAVTLLSSLLVIGFFALRQRSLTLLQQERNLLRTLIDQLPDYIHVKDLQSRFLVANRAVARVMGAVTPEDLLGKTDAEFYPPDLAGHYREDELRILRTGIPLINKDEPHIGPDGTLHTVLTTKIPMRDAQGQIVGVVGLSRDITERKRAEEEIQRLNANLERRVQERTAALTAANAELETFSYSVSHDLRAPLRHVLGFLNLLQQSLPAPLAPEAASYLRDIEHESARMAVMIEDLLVFSRLSRADLKKSPVELGSLVATAQAHLKPETEGRRIEWKIGPLPQIFGDASLLQQVLSNLLDNAIKFTRTRDPAVIEVGEWVGGKEAVVNGPWSVGQEADSPSPITDDQTVIFVRDNGIGFDPAFAGKLFGPFQRLHTRAHFEGTGVGLATVRRIIQRHGGRTWAEGAEDGGAAFYFSLPRRDARPETAPGEEAGE